MAMVIGQRRTMIVLGTPESLIITSIYVRVLTHILTKSPRLCSVSHHHKYGINAMTVWQSILEIDVIRSLRIFS